MFAECLGGTEEGQRVDVDTAGITFLLAHPGWAWGSCPWRLAYTAGMWWGAASFCPTSFAG